MDSSYTAADLQNQKDLTPSFVADGWNKTSAELDALDFYDFEPYGDAALAELFEGIKTPYVFNETEIFKLREVQSAILLRPYTDYGRKLMISK